jgi:hypothetical protein
MTPGRDDAENVTVDGKGLAGRVPETSVTVTQ